LSGRIITFVWLIALVSYAQADPIHDAAWDDDLAGVRAELDKGVDVNVRNVDGHTPLHFAAVKVHKEIVEPLIAKGEDVNAKREDGVIPLQIAAMRGHKEIAELLIATGTDVNAKNKAGQTPLDWADGGTAEPLRKHGGKTGEELKAEGR
jgi:ankyrin repeat protein